MCVINSVQAFRQPGTGKKVSSFFGIRVGRKTSDESVKPKKVSMFAKLFVTFLYTTFIILKVIV